MADARKKADAEWQIYLNTMETDEEWRLIDKAKKAKGPADNFCDHLLEIIGRRDRPGLERAVTQDMYPAVDPLTQSIRALIDLQERVSATEFATVQAAEQQAKWAMAGCVALSALIALAIFRFILTGVARPLRHMTTAITSLAEGRLEVDIADQTRQDEIGQAARAVATIADNLRHLTLDLRQLIDAVRLGHLSVRVDATPHAGDYKDLVSGLNDLIDAMAAPTRESRSGHAEIGGGRHHRAPDRDL